MNVFAQAWKNWKRKRTQARAKALVEASGIVVKQWPDRTELTRDSAVFATVPALMPPSAWPQGTMKEHVEAAVNARLQRIEDLLAAELRAHPPKGFENEDWDALRRELTA